ncbi:MAG: 4'-phosphopantetheinyl transferase superfamily protein [Bacteroidaceae bacterium]|nr:4'-phosphopantetheinyl transferase superfamily protein [Bacteroidaceae bacterium]
MLLLVDDNLDAFDVEAAMPLLSGQRREKIALLANADDRRESAAAYILLREALGKEYGLADAPVFEYGDYGKPFLQGAEGIHFSMSHCRQAVVCAVADFPLGVDVESLRPYNERLARYTMNDEELSRIESSPLPEVEFVRLWTMKEAVAKLSGRGINNLKNLLTEFEGCIECVEELERGYVYSVAY